ncbi:MAG TPA: UvrD-helicase domain-containing protein, partial [Anaeromyxobacteraceae bacterium]|nr:UvrD-helicase domain-containing protein [Anaeromyxobacteraceae bacterium]
MLDLSTLNPPQREAATIPEGPVLVLAGAGSGKTRVIAHRVAWLLEEGADPGAILAVTFTNKAAAEMRERIGALARGGSKVQVSTFHAFGLWLLAKEHAAAGLPRRFAVLDAGDQIALVRRSLGEVRVDDRRFDVRRVLAILSRAKNALEDEIAPSPEGRGDDYDLAAREVWPRYREALRAQRAVDFDDLIAGPVALLGRDAAVREKYRDRFRHVLVDEYQDTNPGQLRLLELLCSPGKGRGTRACKGRSLCAVGDDDQAIYGWRGAEVRNILRFEQTFPGATEVRLEQNYRSVPAVLEAAHAVVSQLPERRPKKLWTATVGGPKVSLVVTPGEDDEAAFVARSIAQRLARGARPDDIAVLYRTNGQSRPFEEAFRARGIPYEVVGGTEFFDRREVRDVLAYLKLLANPAD